MVTQMRTKHDPWLEIFPQQPAEKPQPFTVICFSTEVTGVVCFCNSYMYSIHFTYTHFFLSFLVLSFPIRFLKMIKQLTDHI